MEDMNPVIRNSEEKKLIGKRIKMNLADNRSKELWKSFMPRLKEIRNKVTAELFSIQVYDNFLDLKNFHQEIIFETWAAIEVSSLEFIPDEMEGFNLTGGLFAVFIHKGDVNTFSKTSQYIFGIWLPASKYLLDDRPHFEIMGEKYRNDDPDSEEEIWIPIKLKE